ncbi:glycosyltransferase [Halovenus sp. WSH3]|uniref:Glycosyltransferase n=1 Tax=Halovenus carboxidivorans TaxID=2692199 RepID=A0A6B0TBH3_9EURY|nr:glycosyltransferase family 2 protein [Halovenus carboxidivorans]MXR52983.1 glycosyltransferase [Halovenus carboxidivorans]
MIGGHNSDRIRPLGLDRFPKYVDGAVHIAMSQYFEFATDDGVDPMSREWDQLLLLDGCRYDMFRQYNTLDGALQATTSTATATPEFLSEIFDGKRYQDTVYVTANPIHRVEEWADVDLDPVFREVIDVWEDEWDSDLGTVPPEPMVTATREAREAYPDCRIIAHFVQPHYPFIGPFGRSIEHGQMGGKARATDAEEGADETPIWKDLRDGEQSPGAAWRAYTENLWYVLPYVRDLVADLPGRTVVTSDHGNNVGEICWPFPVRMYGHPEGIRTPELVTVPWLTIETEQSEPPSRQTTAKGASAETSPDGSDEDDGPLVSVVIPTHFRNEELSRAIASVKSQTYSPVELLVVDDSGIERARPVVEGEDIRYIAHEKTRGANQARTTGIEAAEGEYVQLLDDDDCLHPKKLARQVELLESDPDVGVAFCGEASSSGLRVPSPSATGRLLEETLQFGPKACTTSTMLISASTLDGVLPLADRDGADDIGLRIELARRTAFDHVSDALVYRGGGEDRRSERPAVGYELLKIVNEYSPLYDERDPSIRRAALKKAYTTIGQNSLRHGGWSLTAPVAFLRALEYEDDRSFGDLARPAVAMLGDTGYDVASTLYTRLVDRLRE